MSDSQASAFAKLVPGFEFLQNLAKSATQSVPQVPQLAQWVAPTLNAEELDKRIAELRAVQFWLDQNSKGLAATVQALEVQKMTLNALKGMNFDMAELANAFKLKPSDGMLASLQKAAEWAVPTSAAAAPVAAAKPEPVAPPSPPSTPAAPASPLMADPMHLWTALTQQFQHLAAGALQEASKAGASITQAATQAAATATEKVRRSTRSAASLASQGAPEADDSKSNKIASSATSTRAKGQKDVETSVAKPATKKTRTARSTTSPRTPAKPR
jgi:vacuolar-type H+-ATPase subunit H